MMLLRQQSFTANLMGKRKTLVKIETQFRLEYADYKHAQRLYLKHRPVAGFWWLIFYLLIPAASWVFIAWCLWLKYDHDADQFRRWSGQGVVALWLGLFLPIGRWYSMRRAYKRIFPKGVVPVTNLTIDDEQIVSAIPGRSEGKFYWRAVLDYAENREIALIFVRKKLFLMVPNRGLTSLQWDQLRTLIEQKRSEFGAM